MSKEAENFSANVLIASNLISGKRIWYIGLETEDSWHDLKPFEGTEKQKNDYIDQLVLQAQKYNFPLKEIHVAPIGLAG